jgi:hypothetical protein
MEYKDLFIGPIYLLLIYFIAFSVRNKICVDKSTRRYFIPALTLKMFGAIMLGLVYKFYYKGGDTLNYFVFGSQKIWEAFLEKPAAGLWMIFGSNCDYQNQYSEYLRGILFFCDPGSYFIVRLSGFLGLFTFHTYSATAMLFALISFAGVWSMFTTFIKIYPQLQKEIMLACFMLPSVIFWGSGLMKDSITFGCLGLFFSTFYRIFIEKNGSKSDYIIFFISFFVIKTIKIYIILCFIPAALLWLFMVYNNKIKSRVTKILLRPFMIILGALFGYMAANYVSKEDEKYSMENVTKTAKNTSQWLTYVSKTEKGSLYSLGELDYTPMGMLKKFPAAVNVTLFRPYLWESRNIVMILSALESLFFLYLTLSTIIRAGLKRTFVIISDHPIVAASLVFSLTFAFAIGISTSNFGTLVRYKIPIMPFYLISIYVIRSYRKKDIVKKTRIPISYQNR